MQDIRLDDRIIRLASELGYLAHWMSKGTEDLASIRLWNVRLLYPKFDLLEWDKAGRPTLVIALSEMAVNWE